MLTFDITAVIIIVLILVFGILQQIHDSSQTAALKRMADAEESTYFMKVRERREAKAQQDIDWKAWLGEQAEVRILSLDKVLQSPKAISLLATTNIDKDASGEVDHLRVVVSPLGPVELKRVLANIEGKNKLLPNQTPLLGYKRMFKSVQFIEKNLANSGAWFDIAAGKVGAELGVDWGQPERLYFYYVR